MPVAMSWQMAGSVGCRMMRQIVARIFILACINYTDGYKNHRHFLNHGRLKRGVMSVWNCLDTASSFLINRGFGRAAITSRLSRDCEKSIGALRPNLFLDLIRIGKWQMAGSDPAMRHDRPTSCLVKRLRSIPLGSSAPRSRGLFTVLRSVRDSAPLKRVSIHAASAARILTCP